MARRHALRAPGDARAMLNEHARRRIAPRDPPADDERGAGARDARSSRAQPWGDLPVGQAEVDPLSARAVQSRFLVVAIPRLVSLRSTVSPGMRVAASDHRGLFVVGGYHDRKLERRSLPVEPGTGADPGARTRNLRFTKPLLYRLS